MTFLLGRHAYVVQAAHSSHVLSCNLLRGVQSMTARGDHDEFGGLYRDLVATGAAIDRRSVFRMAARLGGGLGALQLLGCSSSTSPSAAATTPTTTPTTSGACSVILNETEGPFPGDGSNGPNVLSLTGVQRSDIRTSFASLSGTADGVPLAI